MWSQAQAQFQFTQFYVITPFVFVILSHEICVVFIKNLLCHPHSVVHCFSFLFLFLAIAIDPPTPKLPLSSQVNAIYCKNEAVSPSCLYWPSFFSAIFLFHCPCGSLDKPGCIVVILENISPCSPFQFAALSALLVESWHQEGQRFARGVNRPACRYCW